MLRKLFSYYLDILIYFHWTHIATVNSEWPPTHGIVPYFIEKKQCSEYFFTFKGYDHLVPFDNLILDNEL